jgi:signal transduction histidine kinase
VSRTTKPTILVVADGLAALADELAAAVDGDVVTGGVDRLSTESDIDAAVIGDTPPGQDGVALFRSARQTAPTVPVLLAAPEPAADRVETALRAGVTDYVEWDGNERDTELLAARLGASLTTPPRDGAIRAASWEAVVSDLAHDAKNPLNVVGGRLELLDIDEVHDEAMTRSVDRVASLLDDLSVLSTLETPVTDVERVSLPECARTVWSELVTDDAELAIETDRELEADPARLKLVLERLFENAVVHGGDGVTVTLGETADGFYVADDGPGIPAEDRAQVFDQGYSTTRYGEGYGLFVARRGVLGHGWSITAGESESGGARFDVATDE